MNEPSIHRRNAWFRIMWWLLPTGFAVVSIAMFGTGLGFVPFGHLLALPLGFAANLVLWIFAGHQHAILSPKILQVSEEQRETFIRRHTIVFCLLQLLVVPILGGALAFGACMVLVSNLR